MRRLYKQIISLPRQHHGINMPFNIIIIVVVVVYYAKWQHIK